MLVVDWRKGAMVPQYSQAAANVRTVAAEIARFINGHMNNFGLDAKTIHCVGLGLGAQACALAAPKIQGLRRMGRITGKTRTINHIALQCILFHFVVMY